MISSWLNKASLAVVAVAGLGLATTSTQAGSITLGTSGWVASWDASLDSRLGLNVEAETTDSIFVEKFATFTANDINGDGGFINPMAIVFQKVSPSAVPFIVINDEMVVNQTGQDWDGFRFILLPSNGSVVFDAGQTDIAPPGSGFSIDPFTASAYNANNTQLDVSGGVVSSVAPNNVWTPGATSGQLVINTAATTTNLTAWALKEMPNAGFVIPLPAAAWSGLSGLLGLAVIGSRKHLRKMFA